MPAILTNFVGIGQSIEVPLSVKEAIALGPLYTQRYSGDNTNSQTVILRQPVSMIVFIGAWDATSNAYAHLEVVASLTGKARGVTLSDNTVTFGDGTDGYKPAASKIIHIVYAATGFETKTYNLNVTPSGTVDVGDNKPPDTDTAIDLRGADAIHFYTLTPSSAAGTATFDFHMIFGPNSTTFASDDRLDLDLAVAEQKAYYANVTPGSPWGKVRWDLNAASIVSGENLTMTVVVTYKLKGSI